MKRIFKLILSTCMIVILSYNSLYAQTNENIGLGKLYTNPNFDYNAFISHANRSLYGITTIHLDVKHYFQADSRWKDIKLGTFTGANSTIGVLGCALTDLAMNLHYFLDGTSSEAYINPKTVNEKLGSIASDCGGMCWSDVGKKYPVTLEFSDTKTYSQVVLESKAAINQNLPYIIGLSKGSTTHFVLATGYVIDEVGKTLITINDSSSVNYTALDSYINNGYRVRIGVLYSY